MWLRVRGQDKGPGQVRLERGLQAAWAGGLGRVAASLPGKPTYAVKVILCGAQAKVVVGSQELH